MHVLLQDRRPYVQADDAVAVDQEGLGHARQAPIDRDRAVEIVTHLPERIAEAVEPGARLLGLVLPGNADQGDAVLLRQALEQRLLGEAGRAPAREEVHQYRLARM